jgi:hypothetical protein
MECNGSASARRMPSGHSSVTWLSWQRGTSHFCARRADALGRAPQVSSASAARATAVLLGACDLIASPLACGDRRHRPGRRMPASPIVPLNRVFITGQARAGKGRWVGILGQQGEISICGPPVAGSPPPPLAAPPMSGTCGRRSFNPRRRMVRPSVAPGLSIPPHRRPPAA